MSRQCHTPGKRSYPTRAAALAALRAPFTGLYAPVRVYRCRCGEYQLTAWARAGRKR